MRARLVGFVFIAVIGSPPHGLKGQSTTLQTALDDYARGRADSVRQLARSGVGGLAAVRRDFERSAQAWLSRGRSEDLPSRRIVVTAVALEYAHALLADLQSRAGVGPFQNPARHSSVLTGEFRKAGGEIKELIEWACDLLRSAGPPSPAERLWFLGSIQLLRDFDDPDVRPVAAAGIEKEYGRAPGHLGHARGRYPDEPWFRVMVAERQTNRLASALRVRRGLTESEFAKIEWLRTNPDNRSSARDRSVEYAYLSDLRRARRDFQVLVETSSVSSRVHLNLGAIAYAFADPVEAASHFRLVPPSTANPCLIFLGHLLTGRMDEELGRPQQAEQSYREALEVMPRAQSVAISLAGVLRLAGRVSDAQETLDEAFSGTTIADDPWTAFQNAGHCTEWPQFIRSLRTGLRE